MHVIALEGHRFGNGTRLRAFSSATSWVIIVALMSIAFAINQGSALDKKSFMAAGL